MNDEFNGQTMMDLNAPLTPTKYGDMRKSDDSKFSLFSFFIIFTEQDIKFHYLTTLWILNLIGT